MRNRRVFYILSLLFIANSICFWWYGERILFFIYGFDQHVIDGITPESFKAYRSLEIGKKIYGLLTLFLSAGTAIVSFRILNKGPHINRFFLNTVFYLACVSTLFCIIGFVVGFAFQGVLILWLSFFLKGLTNWFYNTFINAQTCLKIKPLKNGLQKEMKL